MPAALSIGQHELFATELLFENSILFAKKLDDCILLAADPTGHRGYKDLPRLEDGGGHPLIVARQRNIR